MQMTLSFLQMVKIDMKWQPKLTSAMAEIPHWTLLDTCELSCLRVSGKNGSKPHITVKVEGFKFKQSLSFLKQGMGEVVNSHV